LGNWEKPLNSTTYFSHFFPDWENLLTRKNTETPAIQSLARVKPLVNYLLF